MIEVRKDEPASVVMGPRDAAAYAAKLNAVSDCRYEARQGEGGWWRVWRLANLKVSD